MDKANNQNCYVGKITKLTRVGPRADVEILISPGIELSATIPKESLAELKLKKGQEVYTLFPPSSAALLTTDNTFKVSAVMNNPIWALSTPRA
jgi:molybdopterin-binding protein